jgi:hypothetical protein
MGQALGAITPALVDWKLQKQNAKSILENTTFCYLKVVDRFATAVTAARFA